MSRAMLQGCNDETVHHKRSSRQTGRPSCNTAALDCGKENSGAESTDYRRWRVSPVDGAGHSASKEGGAQIVEKAIEISRKRRGYLDAMRKAICTGDKDSVFELARKLTGLSSDEKSHRVN